MAKETKYVMVQYFTNNKYYTFKTTIPNLRPDEFLITETGNIVTQVCYPDKPTVDLKYKWIAGRVS